MINTLILDITYNILQELLYILKSDSKYLSDLYKETRLKLLSYDSISVA